MTRPKGEDWCDNHWPEVEALRAIAEAAEDVIASDGFHYVRELRAKVEAWRELKK